MTPQEMIEVIEAHIEGNRILARAKPNGIWSTTEEPSWDFNRFDYKVDDDIQDVWINIYPDGSVACHLSREEANKQALPKMTEKAVHFRRQL